MVTPEEKRPSPEEAREQQRGAAETAPLSPTAFFHVGNTARTPGSRAERRSLDLQEQEIFDDFRLVRLLGKGGMGEVWEAEQLSLARRVALKFMQPGQEDDGYVRLFAREARAGGRLNHAGIVAVYATGESRGLHWIAQELVEGGSTLHDYLRAARSQEQLPRGFDRDVAELFRRIAEALHVAHQAGVLHRDLKPRNILIDPSGQPKIGDFGLARIEDEPTQLGDGAIAGTYTYMSPEQIEGRELDARTDVFSLGIVMYEVLTGGRPFGDGSRQDVVIGITSHEPRAPRSLRRTIPAELAVLCMRALEKHPADRYPDAGEFALELGRFLRDEPIRSRSPGLALRTRKWTRRHPVASVAMALGVVALLVILPLATHLSSARRDRVQEQRGRYFESASRYFAVADIERGLEEVGHGIALDPEHPMGYLIAAAGFTNAGRNREAEEQLILAEQVGFRADSMQAQTPQDHLALGLHPIVRRDTARYAEGLAHLELALEDSRLAPLTWYPIYSLRRTMGDLEGARLALDEYLSSVPSGVPMHAVLSTESLELDGEFEQALAELDRLSADATLAEALVGIPLGRRRGRLLMALGRFEEAEEVLNETLAEHPVDASSMINLALVQLGLAEQRGTPQEESEMRLEGARELAVEAARLDPRLREAWGLRGKLALLEMQAEADSLVPGEIEAWGELRACVERLRELDEVSRLADQLESGMDLLRGYWHERHGRVDEAVTNYRRATELSSRQILARIRLGRMLCSKDNYRSALEPLRAAQVLLEAEGPAGEVPNDPDLLRVFYLDLFAAASREGQTDIDLALDARDELDACLANGRMSEPVERLYFAWSLATAGDELVQDPLLARELLAEVYELFLRVDDPAFAQMIEEIEFACDR